MDSKQYYNDIDFSLNHIDNLNFIIKKHDLKLSSTEKDTLRFYIRRQINSKGIIEACQNVGVDPTTAPMLWLKTKTESVRVTNPLFEKPEEKEFKQLADALIEDLQKFTPIFPVFERSYIKDGHCLVLSPADIHIGKLCNEWETGEKYNQNIAVQRTLEGVKGILDKSSGFNIDKIVFIGGNDILHIDNPKRTTTSGTPQDTDGMWYENFMIAKQLYVDVLKMLIPVADVHFVFNPSNHDYTNGFFLAQVIQSYFKDCINITFDVSISHRKYYKYYDNLIGSTHGDGAKLENLPLLMASESKDWTNSKHRYIYTHHVHHKIAKDFIGCTIESLRSPSGTDSWHHRNGYQHAPKAIEGFLHHKNFGQIARLTHIF